MTVQFPNEKIRTFLLTFYAADYPSGIADCQQLIVRYLAEEKTGEYTARLRQLIVDAA